MHTDGSKSCDGVGCAALTPHSQEKGVKLHPAASVMTAELYAILAAVSLIYSDSHNTRFAIFSDSLSSLKAVRTFNPQNSLANRIRFHLHILRKRGKMVDLIWIPGHVGLNGNELADRLAKSSTKRDHFGQKLTIPATDIYSTVSTIVQKN